MEMCVEGKPASGVERFRLDSRKNLCWQGSVGKVNHEVRKEDIIREDYGCVLSGLGRTFYVIVHTTDMGMGSSASFPDSPAHSGV